MLLPVWTQHVKPGPLRCIWLRGMEDALVIPLLQILFLFPYFLPVSVDQTSICFELEPK